MKTGFIGLGRMGRGMAARLHAAGHDLVLFDVSDTAGADLVAAGAGRAASPAALARDCDLVFTSLPTPADVMAVCHGPDGLAEGFRKGTTWFDLTTNSLSVVRDLHTEMAARGVQFLDAPVSGGPGGAASGKRQAGDLGGRRQGRV
ncbi:NAD(P)-dependent oxidoreductase [Antarctobacter sp.]|uniref:NAD(P)-dependent oxidoreductase n=1 Tax=Antarctobacter sp. TaxID=1872577 RepID=UPI003A921381